MRGSRLYPVSRWSLITFISCLELTFNGLTALKVASIDARLSKEAYSNYVLTCILFLRASSPPHGGGQGASGCATLPASPGASDFFKMSVIPSASYTGLDETVVTKDIPPGWSGPSSTTRTLEEYKREVAEWLKITTMEGDEARVTALKFRLSEGLRKTALAFPARAADPALPDAQLPTHYEWYWRMMDENFGGPLQEIACAKYDKFLELRRGRGMHLRDFVTLFITLMSEAMAAGMELGSVIRTHFFFKMGRFSEDQKRWALQPVQGDYNQDLRIRRAIFEMPEELSKSAMYIAPEEGAADISGFDGLVTSHTCVKCGSESEVFFDAEENTCWNLYDAATGGDGAGSADGYWSDPSAYWGNTPLGPEGATWDGAYAYPAEDDGWYGPQQQEGENWWPSTDPSLWAGWGDSEDAEDGYTTEDDEAYFKSFMEKRKSSRAWRVAKGKGPMCASKGKGDGAIAPHQRDGPVPFRKGGFKPYWNWSPPKGKGKGPPFQGIKGWRGDGKGKSSGKGKKSGSKGKYKGGKFGSGKGGGKSRFNHYLAALYVAGYAGVMPTDGAATSPDLLLSHQLSERRFCSQPAEVWAQVPRQEAVPGSLMDESELWSQFEFEYEKPQTSFALRMSPGRPWRLAWSALVWWPGNDVRAQRRSPWVNWDHDSSEQEPSSSEIQKQAVMNRQPIPNETEPSVPGTSVGATELSVPVRSHPSRLTPLSVRRDLSDWMEKLYWMLMGSAVLLILQVSWEYLFYDEALWARSVRDTPTDMHDDPEAQRRVRGLREAEEINELNSSVRQRDTIKISWGKHGKQNKPEEPTAGEKTFYWVYHHDHAYCNWCVSNTSGTSSGDLRAFTDYVVDVKTLHRAISEVNAARENAETRDAAQTGLWDDRTPESPASRASRVPSYRVTDPAIPKSRRVLMTARMLSLFVVAAAVYAIEQIPVTESFRMPSHVSLHVGLLTIGQWVAAPPAVALRFPQFAGIVGYEPSARRGLLVDTGAAINIHGSEWAKHYLEEVLSPNQRTMQK